MKKLFSILAIAALVFAGTLTQKQQTCKSMPINVQLYGTATVTIIQDEDGFH